MMYSIYEENIDRLDKKMTAIQNKCKKYGCDFKYEKVGEEYKEYTNPATHEKSILRYIIVDAEGIAIVNDWKFIATIEHTSHGNILRAACDAEIPKRFYTCSPYCEHCKIQRFRKDTFLVQNTKTGEFKQVGRNCLKDFTKGLDADAVAQYMSAFDELIQGEYPVGEDGCYEVYYSTEEILRYAYETVRNFGYEKYENEYSYNTVNCTKIRVIDYYNVDHGSTSFMGVVAKDRKYEMEKYHFNVESEAAYSFVKDALEWIKNQEESNDYMHNLKTVCSLDYQPVRNIGILVSLVPTYLREEGKKLYEKKSRKISNYVGEVGDKVEFDIDDIVCLASNETQWGYCNFYKITDTEGNVYTWSTSVPVMENYKSIKGTVKSHEEYRGEKQTVLTRCKIKYEEKHEEKHEDDSSDDVEDAIKNFLNYCNA